MSMTGDDFDLEAELNAALDGDKPPVEPQEQIEEQAPAEETPEQEQARYVREGRRFVKEQKEEAAAAKEGDKPAPQEAQPKPASIKKPLWYKDEYGDWDKLAEPFRKALEQREKEYAQGIEKHATSAKAWEPVNELVKPFEQQLRAQGQTPQQFIGGLVNIYGYLQQDPVQALNWLAQNTLGAGWDIRALADWMDQQNVQTQRQDPMQQELAQLRQQVQQLSQLPQQQQQQAINTTLSEWSKDKPYYAELQATMTGLIAADPSVRERFRVDPKATLDALYEQASYAHPQVRERILEERDRAKEDQRLAALKRAREAGAQSPRGGQPNGALRNQRPTMSLEDEIAMHLDGGV